MNRLVFSWIAGIVILAAGELAVASELVGDTHPVQPVSAVNAPASDVAHHHAHWDVYYWYWNGHYWQGPYLYGTYFSVVEANQVINYLIYQLGYRAQAVYHP